MYFTHHIPYNNDYPILKENKGVEETTGGLIKSTSVGFNKANVKAVPAGLFIAKIGNETRFLPRDRATAAVNASATIPVTYPELFKVGDEIKALEAKAEVTLGGTWAEDDILTLSVGDKTYNFVNTDAASTTGAAVAEDAVAALNTSSLSKFARFTQDAAVINIYTTADLGDLAVVENSTSGTATIDSGFDYNYATLGVVQSIDHVNQTITLDGTTTVDQGASIGVLTDEVVGLYTKSIDFTHRPQLVLSATFAGQVYRQSLPYIDAYLEKMFPKLLID